MDYDVCDTLNRKLLRIHGLYEGSWTEKSNLKHPQYFSTEVSSIWSEDEYLNYIMDVGETNDAIIYGHWIYRDGKLSGAVQDHEEIAKRLLTEGYENKGKFSATSEFLNMSGTVRLLINPQAGMLIQCYTRPSLEQMLTLKDIERQLKKNFCHIAWKVADRKNRNILYSGNNLEDLHRLPWSKLK